jgi:uncharacterized membrane protein YobD (UPF0266 family)
MMIGTVTLALFGKKAKFIVTPKEEKKLTVKDALIVSYDSLIFAIVIGVLTYCTYFSIVPTLLLVGCCILTPFAVLAANIAVKEETDARGGKGNGQNGTKGRFSKSAAAIR